MALLNILQFPDPRLKKKADLINDVNNDIITLADNMLETMYEAEGVGLAATQVNQHVRLITIDVTRDQSEPLVIINPNIIKEEGLVVIEEGCLSFPGVYAKVSRSEIVELEYLDTNGDKQNIRADGLLSRCIQHEIDHLNGITFYDHLSPLKQRILKAKIEKIKRRSL